MPKLGLAEKVSKPYLNASVLWALLAWVVRILWLKAFLPIPQMVVTPGYGQRVGTMLGISWVGKGHWP